MNELERAVWASPEMRPTVLVADAAFSEWLKWNEVDLGENCACFDLSQDPAVLKCIGEERAERALFLLSSLSPDVLNMAKKQLVASGAPECCVLTSVSPVGVAAYRPPSSPSPRAKRNLDEDSPYYFVEDLFLPSQASVHYLPVHSIDLLGPCHEGLELRILAKHQLRATNPLTLLSLRMLKAVPNSYRSISDVQASELPDDVRAELKSYAQEVASCLVNELGFDPSQCIYALGKTADLIGHSVRTAAEGLVQDGRRGRMDLTQKLCSSSPLPHEVQPCALILVDRLEDLATVLTSQSTQTCAQRVLNTCRKACAAHDNGFSPYLDISVQPQHLPCSDEETTASPMSAVNGLPFRPPLTLRPPLPLREAFFLLPEETGRVQTVQYLRDCITQEKGRFVVKKRGAGAELLALVTALLESPGASEVDAAHREQSKRLGHTPTVAMKRCNVISMALTLVEALQRSSQKQFANEFPQSFQQSYDSRQQREQSCLRGVWEDLSLATVLHRLCEGSTELATEKMDIAHLCTLIVNAIAASRAHASLGGEPSVTEVIAPHLHDLLLCATPEEIEHLQALRLLTPALSRSLLDRSSATEAALMQGVQEMLRPLEDLVAHYSTRNVANSTLLDYRISPETGLPLTAAGDQVGLCARIVRELYLHAIDPAACTLTSALSYIESPLKQIARAGFGLLSIGLGRLGVNAAKAKTPHPAEQSAVVLCVVGGMSSNEAAQVAQVMLQFEKLCGKRKVVLLSNALLSSDEAMARVFSSNEHCSS